MAKCPPDKLTAQWLLAGRINAALSLLQMLAFVILVICLSPGYAFVNFWGLILGFSINGVVAAVCLSRFVRRTAGRNV